jgi:hypothetical protein
MSGLGEKMSEFGNGQKMTFFFFEPEPLKKSKNRLIDKKDKETVFFFYDKTYKKVNNSEK